MDRISQGENPNLNDIDSTDAITTSGTEADSATNTSGTLPTFNPDVYSFINICFKNFSDSHIKSLKDQISSFKRDLKKSFNEETSKTLTQFNNINSKIDNTILDNSFLKGQYSTLEKYGITIVIFVIVQFGGLIFAYFNWFYPSVQELKTEIQLLKKDIEHLQLHK